MLSSVERMSAVILAKSIVERREYLLGSGEIQGYLLRLAAYRMFSVGELADICGVSEYHVRKMVPPEELLRAKTGVYSRHIDYLLRMIDNPVFSKIHIRFLVKDGASISALARVTGQPESSLRRWAQREE